jgi:hypothetical protein
VYIFIERIQSFSPYGLMARARTRAIAIYGNGVPRKTGALAEGITLPVFAALGDQDVDCGVSNFSCSVFQNCSKSLTATAKKGSTLSESRPPELR